MVLYGRFYTILICSGLKIVNLKNIDGVNILKILDDLVNKRIYKEGNQKPIITLDTESNSLILMASNQELENIITLINELDKEQSQVYVQARIIELNAKRSAKLGS